MRVYGVTGWKNSGKTTLMERLVTEITGRGFAVSTVKHAHHATEIDHEGRDSFRHRQAGAREVLVASPVRWALMHELRDAGEPPLADLLTKLSPVDLVLIEGYKREPHAKVEAHRHETGRPLLAGENASVRAVASNAAPEGLSVPVFHLDDVGTIADFILKEVGL
ncbi:molybdopterin-guanine dinucleotide biosynthesis protein B [Defluviimonas sp. D31]|uniref:molybdopterin-guanine dinucleotide biosynthesis protein B n=1 Tax=Defluviimonas sp. D31 TaxID=3083253 RepID=UPI00296FF623|nr:molybdopterin-guanine dinucleotide biosynthesis protein B [Defluviimonas sp. D31]MDW4550770.1 molybdopterin-guanine dinucleotide biosynthesis protein B [Defluviimonas sp. D31]